MVSKTLGYASWHGLAKRGFIRHANRRATATMAAFSNMGQQLMSNPCLNCGACCSAFRVSFDVSELQSEGGCLPDSLADRETVYTARLRGTDYAQPRCIALVGRVGEAVRCGIYHERPSPCREFAPLAEIGVFATACNRARARHGLPPLPVADE